MACQHLPPLGRMSPFLALLRHHWASPACPLSEGEADVPQTSAEVRV
jgi:hypothetical protein